MEQVTVSSEGQIAIPKSILEALSLSEGTKLSVEVQGQHIVLFKDSEWKKLRGAATDPDLMTKFAEFRKQERELEDSRP